jgi:hypothetical protein
MKIYTVHVKENNPDALEDIVLVEEGFSWYATILHVFWALYNKMWALSAVIFVFEVIFAMLETSSFINSEVIDAVRCGFLLLIGANFNDWYRDYLDKKDYIFQEVVSGKNEDDARYKYITDMLHRTTLTSGNATPNLIY